MRHTIGDIELSWREAGEGEPVLFLHGFPFDSALWDHQLGALPPGWRGIAPDLRGFGESALGAESVHRMELFADDTVALMDHLGLEEAVVCGLSMGGYVAFALHRRHPDRVRALVLADTRAAQDTPDARAGRLRTAEEVRMDGTEGMVEGMLPKLLSTATRFGRPEVVDGLRAMMLRQAPEAVARALVGMAARPDAEAELGGINEPVLILVGEEDAITTKGEAQMMARAIRGARLEVIPEAGHVANLEAPDAFNRALAGLLNGLPR